MNTDITFCNASGCVYKFNCKRHLINYPKHEEEMKYISVSKFEHTISGCDYFIKR